MSEILTNTKMHNRNNERMGNEKHTYQVLLYIDWFFESVSSSLVISNLFKKSLLGVDSKL